MGWEGLEMGEDQGRFTLELVKTLEILNLSPKVLRISGIAYELWKGQAWTSIRTGNKAWWVNSSASLVMWILTHCPTRETLLLSMAVPCGLWDLSS